MRPFFAADPRLWPDVASHLAKPWPRSAALTDLSWWENEASRDFRRFPSSRTLAERWGWTRWQVRQLMRNEQAWRQPTKGSRPDAAQTPPSGRPSYGSKYAKTHKRPAQAPPRRRPKSATRADPTSPPAHQPTPTQQAFDGLQLTPAQIDRLQRAGVSSVQALQGHTAQALARLPGVGPSTVQAVQASLKARGLSLKAAKADPKAQARGRAKAALRSVWQDTWSSATGQDGRYPWEGADHSRVKGWLQHDPQKLQEAMRRYCEAAVAGTAWPHGEPPTTLHFTRTVATWLQGGPSLATMRKPQRVRAAPGAEEALLQSYVEGTR